MRRLEDSGVTGPIARGGPCEQPRGRSEALEQHQGKLPDLRDLLAQSSDHWGFEDLIYRFYHHSFKVFRLQDQTERIVSALRELLPQCPLNSSFLEILGQGTGRVFSADQNADWPRHTRPILEAFFHTRFFLDMAVRYADLPEPPAPLPSGWAALLYLYGIR
jgi:hypothetical protein